MNLSESIEESHTLIADQEYGKAEQILSELYNEIPQELSELSECDLLNYVNCTSTLGNIYMKQRLWTKSLEFYIQANNLSQENDFNILFNIGIVYKQLGDEEECQKNLLKAKTIEPDNQALLDFISNSCNNNSQSSYQIDISSHTVFENEVIQVLKESTK